MLRVLEEAYKVGMCNSVLLDGTLDPRWHDPAEAERNKLSPYRGFWSVTLGAAQALYIDDLVGNFDIGMEADFVVLDPLAGNPAIPWRLSLSGSSAHPTTMSEAADLMFVLMVLGDDRNIAATWAYGRRAYERATSGC
jgi:guanine deaminase